MDINISHRIVKLRKLKKYSISKLADLAGIGQSTLSEIESGTKQPNIVTLDRICSALGLTLSDFFSYDTTREIKPDMIALTNLIHKLNEEQVAALLLVAKIFDNGNK